MTEKRKQHLLILLPILICLTSMLGIIFFGTHVYRGSVFENISRFCEMLVEEHPELEPQVIANVKEYFGKFTDYDAGSESRFLAQYGYESSGFRDGIQKDFTVLMMVLFLTVLLLFLLTIWYLDKRNHMRIAELTNYLEQINVGAGGTVIQTKEDKFSHLQDELYKTITSLYQTREAAVAAKVNFAMNLENIAHQLKTPITASCLSLQLMEKETPSQYVQQIRRQLERLNRLEESLLMLARIDAGTLQLEHSPVDVYTVLCLAAENLNDLLAKDNIAVAIPERGGISFYGDLEWTMEACINLMKNCMEHSPAGGTIHCEYSQNPLYIEIQIWDEGKGFAAGDIPHLFKRFYRGDGAAGDGIGIGLSLARSIIALQNGSVTARNLPAGGACFEIRVYCH